MHAIFLHRLLSQTTHISTLSLHDALPIYTQAVRTIRCLPSHWPTRLKNSALISSDSRRDRKSTRLNSSHVAISYAVFCLKKKNVISLFSSSSTHTPSYSTSP